MRKPKSPAAGKKSQCPCSIACTALGDSCPSDHTIESRLSAQELGSYILESVVSPGEETSNAKSKGAKKRPRAVKSLKSPEDISTNAMKHPPPYHNDLSKEFSRILSSSTETDYVDSDSNSLPESLRCLMSGSWYTVNAKCPRDLENKSTQETSSESVMSLLQRTIEQVQLRMEEREKPKKKRQRMPRKKAEETPEETPEKKVAEKLPAGKAKKIRIYPRGETLEMLNKWIGVARWTYNRCLKGVKDEGLELKRKVLRPMFLNAAALEDKPWVTEVPYDVRDAALDDLFKAYDSNHKKAPKHGFEIKPRSRRDKQQSVVIRLTFLTPRSIKPNLTYKIQLKNDWFLSTGVELKRVSTAQIRSKC